MIGDKEAAQLHKSAKDLINIRIKEFCKSYDHVICTDSAIDNLIQYIEKLMESIRRVTKLKILDRHKVLGVVTLSILTLRPLGINPRKDGKAYKVAHISNELLAIILCKDILFHYMFRDYCINNKITSENSKQYYDYLINRFSTPENVCDKADVENCYLYALTCIKPDHLSTFVDITVPASQLGDILLIAHIYFYFETFNLKNWNIEINALQ